MVGWISSEPAKVAKPQSLPAITFSRPTTLANLAMPLRAISLTIRAA